MKSRNHHKEKPKDSVIKTFKVHSECGLLDFVLERMNDSRNNIKTYLKNRQFLVNGVPISQFDYKLLKDDVVVFSKERYRKEEKRQVKAKLDIIFEDDELIAINKPSGLLSIESDNETIETAYHLVYNHVIEKDKHARIYTVHRIDKDTSGIMIFSKTENLRNILQKNWGEIVKKREYIALCDGVFENKSGTIKSYLMKNINNLMYSSKNKEDGKLAITHYKVMKENDKYTMVDVLIDTGRKNQIRVHMKDLGHSVLGDTKYQSPSDPIGRLCLHAYKLEFNHPITHKLYSFKAEIPKEFSKLF